MSTPAVFRLGPDGRPIPSFGQAGLVTLERSVFSWSFRLDSEARVIETDGRRDCPVCGGIGVLRP